MVNINDLTITSIETINAFGIDGTYKFTLDELQSATIAQGQETSDVTGKAGRKLATLKRNKSVTVSGTNGLISGGLMEAQTGSTFEKKAGAKVLWVDYLTAATNKVTTTYNPVGTAGNEIVAVYIKDSNGIATELESASSASAGKYTYSNKAITLSNVADGTEVVVFYYRELADASVLVDSSDKYSATLQLYIDAIAEDKCANIYRVQFYVPKADFNGEFSIEMSDSQAVHEFEASALSGACGTAGQFFTYTVFGENTADKA